MYAATVGRARLGRPEQLLMKIIHKLSYVIEFCTIKGRVTPEMPKSEVVKHKLSKFHKIGLLYHALLSGNDMTLES